jgi:hypothetical protein
MMFKKLNFVEMVLVLFFSTCFVQTALSEPLVIKGDYAFLADGDLIVYNIKDVEAVETIDFGDVEAVDVAISGTNAVVTVKNNESPLSIMIVDISEYCIADSDSEDENQDSESSTCENEVIADYDIDNGLLTISNIELNGEICTIEMKRRGNSMNWEVIFIDESDSGDLTENNTDMNDSEI